MRIITLFLLFSISLTDMNAQKVGVLRNDESVSILVKGDYLVEQDTSSGGVITVRLTPSESLRKEVESKLGGVETEEVSIAALVSDLQRRLEELASIRKELLSLLQQVGNGSPGAKN